MLPAGETDAIQAKSQKVVLMLEKYDLDAARKKHAQKEYRKFRKQMQVRCRCQNRCGIVFEDSKFCEIYA